MIADLADDTAKLASEKSEHFIQIMLTTVEHNPFVTMKGITMISEKALVSWFMTPITIMAEQSQVDDMTIETFCQLLGVSTAVSAGTAVS